MYVLTCWAQRQRSSGTRVTLSRHRGSVRRGRTLHASWICRLTNLSRGEREPGLFSPIYFLDCNTIKFSPKGGGLIFDTIIFYLQVKRWKFDAIIYSPLCKGVKISCCNIITPGVEILWLGWIFHIHIFTRGVLILRGWRWWNGRSLTSNVSKRVEPAHFK